MPVEEEELVDNVVVGEAEGARVEVTGAGVVVVEFAVEDTVEDDEDEDEE